MNTGYPTYPNPTIVEAICDIHFRLVQGKEWKPSLPGELFKHVQDDYPEMEPVVEIGFQLDIGPLGSGTQMKPQRQKVRFKHRTRSLVLQLGENSLSVSILPPYQGWHGMYDDVLSIWQRVADVLQPEAITSVGLRYINRITKETVQDHPGTWLKENDYVSKGILQSCQGFLLHIETHLNDGNMMIITLGDTKSGVDEPFGAIVFDIGQIAGREIVSGSDALGQEMNRLHAAVWDVFSSAKGEKLEALLSRRPQ